jgi:DnaK suppressor protein
MYNRPFPVTALEARTMAAKKAVSKKKKRTTTKKKAVKKAPRKKAAAKRSAGRPAARKKAAKKAAKKKVAKKAPKKTTKKKATKKKVAKKKVAKKSAKKTGKKATKKKVVKRKAAGKAASARKTKTKKGTVAKTSSVKKKPVAKKAVAKKRPVREKAISKKTPARARSTGRGKPNLLTGPVRGFDPYQPKRGEDYMSDEQLAHFRALLDAWKTELMEEVDRTMLHMKDDAANFPDPNDRATQESEFGLELRTRDRERKLLKKIDAALQRVDDQSYGYCEATGEEIGLRRLEARPVATLCVEAQERRERAEKQYRDREDYYR